MGSCCDNKKTKLKSNCCDDTQSFEYNCEADESLKSTHLRHTFSAILL